MSFPARVKLTLLVLSTGLSGCDLLNPDPVMCTTEFRMLTLFVQDPLGAPLTDARVDVRTRGEPASWPGTGLRDDGEPGRYVIVHDGHADRIGRGSQVSLEIVAISGALQGTATWVVGSDACHIYKVVGTDTLTLR
jgi:hypothetical protein